MVRLIISGCNGRMGRVVETICSADPEFEIVAGFDLLGAAGDRDFPIYSSPSEFQEQADVVVDFSSPAALDALLEFGLQRRLMEVTEEALAAKGIRYLFCTAHPENTYSQNNIRSLGYEAFLQKDMYGGYRRDLFIKCI